MCIYNIYIIYTIYYVYIYIYIHIIYYVYIYIYVYIIIMCIYIYHLTIVPISDWWPCLNNRWQLKYLNPLLDVIMFPTKILMTGVNPIKPHIMAHIPWNHNFSWLNPIKSPLLNPILSQFLRGSSSLFFVAIASSSSGWWVRASR